MVLLKFERNFSEKIMNFLSVIFRTQKFLRGEGFGVCLGPIYFYHRLRFNVRILFDDLLNVFDHRVRVAQISIAYRAASFNGGND